MATSEITVIDAPFQRLDTYLNDTAVTLDLSWNTTSARWSLGVMVAGVVRLQGRRLVPGVDLFGGYELGLGRLFLVEWSDRTGLSDRDALPSGALRLIHDDGLTA